MAVDINHHLAESVRLRQEFERLFVLDDIMATKRAAVAYVQHTDAALAGLLRKTGARSPAEMVS